MITMSLDYSSSLLFVLVTFAFLGYILFLFNEDKTRSLYCIDVAFMFLISIYYLILFYSRNLKSFAYWMCNFFFLLPQAVTLEAQETLKCNHV